MTANLRRFRLAPIPWTLLRPRDFQAMWSQRSVDGGYMNAGSAQACFYEDGTLGQAAMLREAFRRDASGCPSPAEAERLFRALEHEVFHYIWQRDSELWWIRNQTNPRFDAPLRGTWHLAFLKSPESALVLGDGEVAAGLALFQHLNGTLGLEDLVERASASPVAERVLAFLVEHELLEVVPSSEVRVEALPEFLFLAHAGVAVREGGDLLIVDPLIVPALARFHPQRDAYQVLSSARAMAISHHHWDHLHLQTLARIRRDLRCFVPRVRTPSFANPPVAGYLRALGFTDVIEVDPDQRFEIGDLRLATSAFFGEPFGLASRFDAFCYDLSFSGKRLVGTVDACHDEAGDMRPVIGGLAAGRPIDMFLFGSSAQRHDPMYAAAGLRHLSNELVTQPKLMRYHPNADDAAEWMETLRPQLAVPYAQFLLAGSPRREPDVPSSTAATAWSRARAKLPAKQQAWAAEIDHLATRTNVPMAYFEPMQGLRLG